MKSLNIISWITDPIAAIKIFKNKTNQKPNIETKQTNERMNKQQTNKKQTKQTKHAKHNTHKAGLKISFFLFHNFSVTTYLVLQNSNTTQQQQ